VQNEETTPSPKKKRTSRVRYRSPTDLVDRGLLGRTRNGTLFPRTGSKEQVLPAPGTCIISIDLRYWQETILAKNCPRCGAQRGSLRPVKCTTQGGIHFMDILCLKYKKPSRYNSYFNELNRAVPISKHPSIRGHLIPHIVHVTATVFSHANYLTYEGLKS
jgi:hypothetical protein